MPFSERQDVLLDQYFFDCRCPPCAQSEAAELTFTVNQTLVTPFTPAEHSRSLLSIGQVLVFLVNRLSGAWCAMVHKYGRRQITRALSALSADTRDPPRVITTTHGAPTSSSTRAIRSLIAAYIKVHQPVCFIVC